MVSAKDFIINRIKDLVLKIRNIKVRYEYDSMASVHTVEVLPCDTYRNDEDYIRLEAEFYDDFIKNYPEESICFQSSDAPVRIENADYVLAGTDYYISDYFQNTLVNIPDVYSNLPAWAVNVQSIPSHEVLPIGLSGSQRFVKEEDYSLAA
jgi:hypothetical protein